MTQADKRCLLVQTQPWVCCGMHLVPSRALISQAGKWTLAELLSGVIPRSEILSLFLYPHTAHICFQNKTRPRQNPRQRLWSAVGQLAALWCCVGNTSSPLTGEAPPSVGIAWDGKKACHSHTFGCESTFWKSEEKTQRCSQEKKPQKGTNAQNALESFGWCVSYLKLTSELLVKKKTLLWGFLMGLPGGPGVKTSPSNAGHVGSIPGRGARSHLPPGQKTKTEAIL